MLFQVYNQQKLRACNKTCHHFHIHLHRETAEQSGKRGGRQYCSVGIYIQGVIERIWRTSEEWSLGKITSYNLKIRTYEFEELRR
jgi:hypothetical protein